MMVSANYLAQAISWILRIDSLKSDTKGTFGRPRTLALEEAFLLLGSLSSVEPDPAESTLIHYQL